MERCPRFTARHGQLTDEERMTMKAWQYPGTGETFELNEVPVPVPGPGEVLVDVRAAGLCHSDITLMTEPMQRAALGKTPITLGHEIAGVVAAVGDGVTGWQIGDRAGVCPTASAAPPGTDGPGAAEVSPGIGHDGGFAEKYVGPAHDLVRIPDAVDITLGAVATDAGSLGRDLFSGLAKIDYNAGRDGDALHSLLRLSSPAGAVKTKPIVDSSIQAVRRFASQQSERLRDAVSRRAAELDIAAPVKAVPPPADPRRAEAARMIVRRKRFGPVTLDDLPVADREGFPGFAGTPTPLVLLTWCDGRRTLDEVIRLIELEQGPMDFDFVGYFRFLAKHGYVEILQGSSPG